uniref:ATP synthase subunit d, mitochondrial n=1 Tax=Oncorhynchus tshawytscha TaxID=74940 RepID=A0AAZ3RQL2_ONCTS
MIFKILELEYIYIYIYICMYVLINLLCNECNTPAGGSNPNPRCSFSSRLILSLPCPVNHLHIWNNLSTVRHRKMAGKRAALKAIDWLAFAERVPPNQRAMFNNLKTRSDAIGAKLSSLPEKPVTIDWSFYKTNVARAGMVAEFESKFSALTIPEPKDTATAAINTQEAEANKAAVAYVEASKARIGQYEKELEKFQNMIPFDQMTIDDLNDTFPETKLDKEKHPYWPHKPIAEL